MKGLDISYHILLLMKRTEPVKLHKLHARPEETEKPSPGAKYVLVITRFQVQYGKYFTSFSYFAYCLTKNEVFN